MNEQSAARRHDRAAELIRSGDTVAVLTAALNAQMAAAEGRFCECDEPILHGRDLMCGACLLENVGQRERLEALIRGPHAYEPRVRLGVERPWCAICAFPESDARHRV